MKRAATIPILFGLAAGLYLTLWLLSEFHLIGPHSDGELSGLQLLWAGLWVFGIVTGPLCCCCLIASGFITRLFDPKSKISNLKS